MAPDIAVLHHRYKAYGGAERVADALADALNADLYALWVDEDVQERTDATPLRQSRYSGLGSFRRTVKAETLLRPAEIENVDLTEYDIVITSGDMAHCYLPADDQRHLHYLHTPNRDYFVGKEMRQLTRGRGRLLKTLLMQYQRAVDQSHAPHVDNWLCNSEFIADRARRFYGLDGADLSVCHPPVDWAAHGPARTDRDGYFVTVGRLVPDKRVGRLVEAFDQLNARLIICGDGRSREALAADAPSNVEVRGYVAEDEKIDLVRGAQGFVFAGARECFGMAVAEALSAGTPVVAADSGNMSHLVVDGENGYLVDAEPAAIATAVRAVQTRDWPHKQIRDDARQFSRERFGRRVREVVLDDEDGHEPARPDTAGVTV